MATFRKRNGKWQVQIRRTGYAPISKSFLVKSDADIWARHMEADLDRQVIPLDKRPLVQVTLADLLKKYRSEITPNKRGAYTESYRIEKFLQADMVKLKYNQITPQIIANYKEQRLKEVQPSTVRRDLNLLSHVFETARREWLMPISSNPVAVIRKPPSPEARKRRLTDDEREKLLKSCESFRNQDTARLILFALETAMRRSEITSLTWENINLENKTAHLPLTKNGLSRTVPLAPKALEILKAIEPRAGSSVFNLTNTAVRLAWERVCKKAGIVDLHFHDLRHEAISRFFEKGLSVPEVALISGHRDMRMLFRYTHLKPEDVAIKLASGVSSNYGK